MNLLIRSTSFLMQDPNIWISLKKHDIKFADYGNLFQNNKLKKKINFDISIIFLQDLIDDFYLKNNKTYSNKNKIQKFLQLIKNKVLYQKEINHIFFISSYSYFNNINTLKFQGDYTKDKDFFLYSLYGYSKKYKNIFIVNLDEVFSVIGFKNCFDNRNYSLFRCRLSLTGVNILISEIKSVIKNFETIKKKVLLLDCDNTLWGGVVGEDGIEKIRLGQDGIGIAFQNFQRAIKKIKDSGIILAILSKNNESDVKEVFKKHKSMILRDSDIAVYKVNWEEKSKNIKKISEELNLDPNSFVFWDDNPIEREKVRKNFKNLDVIDPEKEIADWSKQLLEYKGFAKHEIVKEDLKKTEQYKSRNRFLNSKDNAENEIEFLKKLKIKPSFEKVGKSNISRAVQLSNKTNQFNFNSKRLNELSISENSKQENYIIGLKDDFGDHGYVGLVGLKIHKNFILVDQFVMSCRILGRYLEYWILNKIKDISKKKKINNLIFEYVKTEKNQVTEKFIQKINFKLMKKKTFDLNTEMPINSLLVNKKSKLLKLSLDKKIKYLEIYGY